MYRDKVKSRLMHLWCDMRNRCYDPTHHAYHRYGGRGIKICDEWLSFENFYNWAIDNGYKVELLPNGKNKWSIDRINNDGNYCPENCRWTDFITQQYNRSINKYIKYNNKIYNTLELSKELNISQRCLLSRLKRGWNIEDLAKPPMFKNVDKVVYKGKEYTYAELAKEYGLKTTDVRNRIKQFGWDVEKAITLPKCKIRTNIRLYEYKGKMMTITDIAKDLGIGRTTLQYRMKACNYNLEEVLKKGWGNIK